MTILRTCLIAVAVLVAACGRIDPEAELAAAKADLAAGNSQAASIRLANVLKADPVNAEAHLMRGEIALAIGDYGAAVFELERSAVLGIPSERVALSLAEAFAYVGAEQRALAVLDEARDTLERGADYWVTRAEVALLAQRLDEAAESLARAAQRGADSPRYHMALARAAMARGDAVAADAHLGDAAARAPTDPDVRAARGELYVRLDRLAEAAADLAAAADQFQSSGRTLKEARVLLGLVQVHLATNDLDAAARAADRLLQRVPQAGFSSYVRGLIEYRQGRFDAAAVSLQNAINAAPDNAEFLTLLAAVQLAQGNLGQAEQHLLRVVSTNPRDPAAIKLLAETRLRQQRPSAALETLRPLAALGAEDPQIGLLTGVANLLAGNLEEGVVYLEQAAALDPGNQLLKLELAKAYSTLGRHSEAAQLLGAGLGGDGSSGLDARLVELLAYARTGDREAGNRAVAELLSQEGRNARAYVVAAMYRQAINEPQEARELLETAVDLDGNLVQARLLLAGALAQEGRTADGEQHLRRAVELDPRSVPALTALAQIVALRNAIDESEALLRQAAAEPTAIAPRLMLAQLYLSQGRLQEAKDRLDEADRVAPGNAEVTAVRGVLALAEGRPGDAAALLEDAQSQMPQRLGLALALAEAHLRNEQPQRARSTLLAVLERAPQSVPLRTALGIVELRLGASAEALAIAKHLQAEFPRERHGYVLEAQVELARRRYAEAASVLRTAYEQEPAWPTMVELVGALQLAGRGDEIIAVLSDWVAENPQDTRARLMLAGALEETGRTHDALAQLEAVLRLDERNIVALNNAAWLYASTDDARALALAERAQALAPDNPAVLDTLGSILLRQNREQDAIGHLAKAAQLAPQALEIRYHLAEAQVAVGQVAEARRTLEALLRDPSSFEQRTAAQALLDRL